MPNYIIENGELKHYGVLGMKWGVRKASKDDRKQRTKLKRELAADKRNVKTRGRMLDTSEKRYSKAKEDYTKTVSSTMSRLNSFWNGDANDDALRKADGKIQNARGRFKTNQAEYAKANAGYEAKAKEYKAHVDSMIRKYGSENIKSVSTKTYEVGKNRTKEMIKTGLTLTEIPFIGRDFAANYIVKRDYAQNK